MSSEYGSKSYGELKQQAKQSMAAAAKTEPAFLVTERNWSGLLKSLDGILEMQSQFSQQMQTLSTKEDLEKMLDRQRLLMEVYTNDLKLRTEEFRVSIQAAGNGLTQQVGKASDDFSKAISREEDSLSSSDLIGAGALDLVRNLSRIKGSSDDPEERKREQDAQRAADNLAVAIGVTVAAASILMEQNDQTIEEQTL